MNHQYAYLWINILSVVFPLLLSFDKKVAFYKHWKNLLPAMLIVGFFFVLWDMLFTATGVWKFNEKYILGIYIFNLPIEEVLFFITVPYACAFIYEVLNAYIQRELLGCGLRLSLVFMVLCLITCVIYYDRIYTVVNAGVCFFLILFTRFIYRMKNMGRFYLAYFVSLLPFLLVNGLITGLPIVEYNDDENMGLRIITIPVEDVFYCLSLLLGTVLVMDYLKNRKLEA